MQKREKKIAVAVIGILGVYALGWVVYLTSVQPWAKQFRSQAKAEQDIRQRIADKERLPLFKREWAELGSRTYSADRGRMNDEMNRQLLRLMETRSGLRQVGGVVMASAQLPVGSGSTATAMAKLQGRGSFDAVLRAIYELSRNQRLGRIEKISITRGQYGFDMTADYTARWLDQPAVKLDQPTANSIRMTYTVSDASKATTQPAPLASSEYASLLGRTMFTRYERQIVRTDPPPVRPVTTRSDPPPPPPPPAPTWRNLSVTGVYQSTDAKNPYYATVADSSTGGTSSLKVGDALADGTIKSIDVQAGCVLLDVGGKVYVVEARRGVTVGDRVLQDDYRPVVRVVLPDEMKP
ncbi:MAG: hypothetical protein PHU85_04570 [Phycisphaerae bacterium]|nr:hypothetical protein [Phycisphaerae bacterium]